MHNNIFYFICICVFFIGCKEKELLDIQELYNPNPDFDVIWHFDYNKDNIGLDSLFRQGEPLLLKNKVFVPIGFAGYTENEVIYKFDALTGEILWQTRMPKFGIIRKLHHYNGQIICLIANTIYSVHFDTGEIVWSYNFYTNDQECVNPSLVLNENFLYLNVGDCFNPGQQYNTMKRINLDNYEIEELISYYRDQQSGMSPFLNNPAFYRNENNELNMLVTVSYFESVGIASTVHLLSYNISTKTYNWIEENIDEKDINYVPPSIHNGKVYLIGSYSVFCLDLETGSMIWENQVPNESIQAFTTGDPIIANYNFIVKPSSSNKMLAFNLESGVMSWYHEDSHVDRHNYFVNHNELIYTVGQKSLIVFEPNAGKIFYETHQSPVNKHNNFNIGGLLIDKESGDIFINDGQSFMRVHLKTI